MATFSVHLVSTASTTVEVEADTEFDARELVWNEDLPTVCAQCSGWSNPPGFELSDEWVIDSVQELS